MRTIWDKLKEDAKGSKYEIFLQNAKPFLYDDIDELEDQILFPSKNCSTNGSVNFIAQNLNAKLMSRTSMAKFCEGYESDDDGSVFSDDMDDAVTLWDDADKNWKDVTSKEKHYFSQSEEQVDMAYLHHVKRETAKSMYLKVMFVMVGKEKTDSPYSI